MGNATPSVTGVNRPAMRSLTTRGLITLSLLLAANPATAQEAENTPGSGSAAVDAADEQQEADPIRTASDEILVVADRFYGQIDAPQTPIATFDEDEIQALGARPQLNQITISESR